jgi:ribose 5-phosphate isomerase B
VKDFGAQTREAGDDYPDYAYPLAKAVVQDGNKGLLFCGNAVGVCVVANKVPGVRAAIGYSKYAAKTSRTDDDANVLCLPGRSFSPERAKGIVDIWLATEFSGAKRHVRRLDKVKQIEQGSFSL